MKKKHRELREKLREMPPREALDLVYGYDLPPQETFCIVECDIRRRSCLEVGQMLYTSPETVWRRRRDAYAKMT